MYVSRSSHVKVDQILQKVMPSSVKSSANYEQTLPDHFEIVEKRQNSLKIEKRNSTAEKRRTQTPSRNIGENTLESVD